MTTILVVDDSPIIHHLLGYTLKHEGYTVATASNGYEALDILATTAVQLAIVDLAMPEMDGFILLDIIRTQEHLKDLQIVMLTASGQDHDRQKAMAAGANGFLTKPTSSRDLIAAVEALLHQAVP